MKTVYIATLGCRVNQYESVAICEALQKRGVQVTKDDTACDYYLIQGYVLWIAVIYMVINLLVDLSYYFIDPRMRLSR